MNYYIKVKIKGSNQPVEERSLIMVDGMLKRYFLDTDANLEYNSVSVVLQEVSQNNPKEYTVSDSLLNSIIYVYNTGVRSLIEDNDFIFIHIENKKVAITRDEINDKNQFLVKKYIAKLEPSDRNKKYSYFLKYNGEIYRHYPGLCNKDKKEFTFIMKEGAIRGYHEKWEDLESYHMFIHDIDTKENIGILSVECTWVKENDTFDVSEIMRHPYYKTEEDEDNDITSFMVLIKCSNCLNYH